MRSVKVALCLLVLGTTAYASSENAYYDYLQGLVEERAGNITKALSAYERVVQKDPQALEAYRDIAQLNLRLGHIDAALQAAEKVKDLAPKDPDSFLFLGNVRVAQGNLAKAAEAYEKTLQLDPENLRALENLGNYYAIVDPTKAIRYYQRYLEIDPKDAEIYFQMGLVYQKSGDTKKAIEVFNQAKEMDPQQTAPHLALAEIYEVQKSTAAAVQEYTECIKRQPRNAAIYMRLGSLHYANRQWDEAFSDFQNVRSLAPQDATANYWLARVSEERRQWHVAADYARQAYEASHDAQFLPLLAYYLTLDRHLEEAVRWLEKAQKGDPNNANVLLFLGMDYLDLSKPEKAKDVLVRGVAHYPNDIQMRFQLGMAFDRLGQFDDAQTQFQDVLRLDPKNSAAMNYLGYSWADRGVHLEEAEKLLRQAVALEPKNGAYLDSLGWTRYKQGDLKEAAAFLEQAVNLEKDALIYGHLGDVYWAQQRVDLALRAWKQSLALDPHNADIRKKVEQAAARVMPGTDQRKYLKYLEGNLRQLADLHGRVGVQAKWHHHPIQTQADLYYQRPDQMVIDINGAGEAPGARFRVQGTSVAVEPAMAAQNLGNFPLGELQSLPEFLSGKLTAIMDDQAVETQHDKTSIHYKSGTLEAWIDPERGVLTRFTRPDPEGARQEIDVPDYDFVEGLWLPREMRLRNRSLGWDAHLKFSDWIVNDPENKKPFNQ